MTTVDRTYICCDVGDHRRLVAFQPDFIHARWGRSWQPGATPTAMPTVLERGDLVCETCSAGLCGGGC